MRRPMSVLNCLAFLSVLALTTGNSFAGGNTEITGYYQQYRDFSFKTGISDSNYDFAPARLKGGGFTVAQNIESWFAIWTQLSVFGTVEQDSKAIRVINNLQGIRYQTRHYGPFRFYGKGGLGFSYYSINILGEGVSGTKFSVAYGGGTDIWIHKNFGIVLDVSHVTMSLPNLSDTSKREGWDSGLMYTTGLTVRF